MSAARDAFYETLRYNGPFVIAPPPTIAEIAADMHPNCNCYSCKALTEFLKRKAAETSKPNPS